MPYLLSDYGTGLTRIGSYISQDYRGSSNTVDLQELVCFMLFDHRKYKVYFSFHFHICGPHYKVVSITEAYH